MVGRRVLLRVEKSRSRRAKRSCRSEDLVLSTGKGCAASPTISFEVRAGEIVGSRASRQRPVGTPGGARRHPPRDRRRGHPCTASRFHPAALIRQLRATRGLRMCPKTATAPDSSLPSRNGELRTRLSWRPRFLNGPCSIFPPSAKTRSEDREYRHPPGDCRLKTANFSGGNQQKIVLAREMERDPWCCWSASRRGASTSARSSSSIASCSPCAKPARRSCWSPSSSTKCARSPTASSSCAAAGSSASARPEVDEREISAY